MHRIIKSTILLSVALMASIAHAALEVKLDNPKTTGNMTVIRLNLKNTGSDTIASVRASIYLLDAQGKMIGQSTRWILGGTKADMLPSRPESQRDSILQPGVGPQRGTTPGYVSAIAPTPTEISAKACSGGLRPPSVRGKPNEARRSQPAVLGWVPRLADGRWAARGFRIGVGTARPQATSCRLPGGAPTCRRLAQNPNGIPSFSPGLARNAGLPRDTCQQSSQPQRKSLQKPVAAVCDRRRCAENRTKHGVHRPPLQQKRLLQTFPTGLHHPGSETLQPRWGWGEFLSRYLG